MSKLDSKPLSKAQRSKSSHDLNHVYDFTSSTGMILPLVCDILNPGESIQSMVDLSETRTMPLDSAAYLDLDMHVDYFFVPMTILFSKFGSFIYRTKDFYSSFDNQGTPSTFELPLLDLDAVKSATESGAYNRVVTSGLGLNFDDLGKGSLRLFDHLGYGTLFNSASSGWSLDSAYNPSIFPWALLAYNAAYEYYFINDEFEKFDNSLFNVDNTIYNSGVIQPSQVPEMFQLKYRNKYHDYFTRIKASPIVSGQNLLDSSGSLSLAKSWLSRDTSRLSNILTDSAIGTDNNDQYGNYSPSSPNVVPDTRTSFGFKEIGIRFDPTDTNNSYLNGNDINTANLRALFANEKLWTITGMNRKQYDAQTLAHFGFDVPVDVMHQVQHIGHHLYNLKVGEVISTAGTANQPLATVAGKGYAFDNKENKPIRFTAPCHGVFIALYSSAIHRNYFGAFRKENAVAGWQDFYQPEFDNLGMQPLFLFETRQDKFGSSSSFSYGNILGWQYRYEQFKSRYDRSTLAFANDFFGSGTGLYNGPFSSWGPSDVPLEGLNFSAQAFNPAIYWKWVLKESPSELNNMMSIAYDPRWYSGATGEILNYLSSPWTMYATDPLVHHAYIKYDKLSTMSTYSLPKLND